MITNRIRHPGASRDPIWSSYTAARHRLARSGYVAGGQRWISTLGIGHGEVLAGTTVGLSPDAVLIRGHIRPFHSRHNEATRFAAQCGQ